MILRQATHHPMATANAPRIGYWFGLSAPEEPEGPTPAVAAKVTATQTGIRLFLSQIESTVEQSEPLEMVPRNYLARARNIAGLRI
jgi:hypothetical protein